MPQIPEIELVATFDKVTFKKEGGKVILDFSASETLSIMRLIALRDFTLTLKITHNPTETINGQPPQELPDNSQA